MVQKTELEKKVEEFRDKISAIQKAVCQIKKTGISENILYLIIKHSSQRFITTNYAKPIKISDVRAIVAGIEDLPNYMFPEIEE